MKRVIILGIIVGLPILVVVLLLGIAIRNQQGTVSAQPVTLTYWGVVDSAEAVQPVLKAYSDIRKNVTVNYVVKDFATYRADLLDALASGAAPDLFQIPATWLSEYATKGRIVELPKSYTVPEYVTKSQLFKQVTTVVQKSVNSITITEMQRNYVPSVTEDSVVGGRIFGLPFAVDTLALFSNRDLLNVAQLPKAPATWDELRGVVGKLRSADAQGNLTRAAIPLGTATTVPHAVDILTGLMAQGGATLIDVPSRTAAFNTVIDETYNPGAAAAELYTSFAQVGKETYTWNARQGDAFTAFADGRVALFLGYQFEYQRLLTTAPLLAQRLDVTPMLHLQSDGTDRYLCATAGGCQPYNVANNWVTAVSKQSLHPNDAWDLIQFFIRREDVQRVYAQSAHRTPVLKTALELSKTGGVEDVWIAQGYTAHTWYHGNDPASAETAMANLITAVGERTTPTAEALDLAARQVTETLR